MITERAVSSVGHSVNSVFKSSAIVNTRYYLEILMKSVMTHVFLVVLTRRLQGHTPLDLAHQVHSPLLIHMLNRIKQERIRSNSRCLRIINRYRVYRH